MSRLGDPDRCRQSWSCRESCISTQPLGRICF